MDTQNPLFQIIKTQIQTQGPITIERYMELCLYHLDHGYYITKDPIGTQADFITSPEISQLFGQMLGVFIGQILIDNSNDE
jgi:SAM-dependent MidA family methyltransferase